MSWISHIVADIHDEDYNGICRPSAILRYLQIAANGQLHGEGPSNEEMRAMGKAFVLTSARMKNWTARAAVVWGEAFFSPATMLCTARTERSPWDLVSSD